MRVTTNVTIKVRPEVRFPILLQARESKYVYLFLDEQLAVSLKNTIFDKPNIEMSSQMVSAHDVDHWDIYEGEVTLSN